MIERTLDNGIKWVYGHHGWCGGAGVAILPFKREGDVIRYLGRYEICPAHDPEPKLGAVAGGMGKDMEMPKTTAVRELKEKTGYSVTQSDLYSLGTVSPSKGTDTIMFLYAVDVTDLENEEPKGDGGQIEQLAYNKWVNKNQAIFSDDPLLGLMVARLEVFMNE